MKLVVEIPEEIYKLCQEKELLSTHPYKVIIWDAVAKGKPLPTGHRFIDADEILNHAFITEDEEGDIFVQKYYCIKKEIMDKALVLFDTLEADKE